MKWIKVSCCLLSVGWVWGASEGACTSGDPWGIRQQGLQSLRWELLQDFASLGITFILVQVTRLNSKHVNICELLLAKSFALIFTRVEGVGGELQRGKAKIHVSLLFFTSCTALGTYVNCGFFFPESSHPYAGSDWRYCRRHRVVVGMVLNGFILINI